MLKLNKENEVTNWVNIKNYAVCVLITEQNSETHEHVVLHVHA